MICLGLLHGLNIFYEKFLKGHTGVFVEEPLSIFLKLFLSHLGFPISIIFKTLFQFLRTCLFHVQYEVSASVTLHRFLCKYVCLLLNYFLSSGFPKAFKCWIAIFPLGKKCNPKMLLRVQTYRTVFYTKCVSVPLCSF